MTQEEIRTKASSVAALYTALANGKTLQFDTSPNQGRMNRWEDAPENLAPSTNCDLSRWRVKPEAKVFWLRLSKNGDPIQFSQFKESANDWRNLGYTVIEVVEVLP